MEKEITFIKDLPPRYTPSGYRVPQSLFKCYCGKEFVTKKYSVKSGNTKSCGCFFLEQLVKRQTTHGKSNSRLYTIYKAMVYRCYRPTSINYKYYGGRGITVCKRWLNSFPLFMQDMGEPPTDKHTIDRKKNSLGYKPSNCKWATKLEQRHNRG